MRSEQTICGARGTPIVKSTSAVKFLGYNEPLRLLPGTEDSPPKLLDNDAQAPSTGFVTVHLTKPSYAIANQRLKYDSEGQKQRAQKVSAGMTSPKVAGIARYCPLLDLKYINLNNLMIVPIAHICFAPKGLFCSLLTATFTGKIGTGQRSLHQTPPDCIMSKEAKDPMSRRFGVDNVHYPFDWTSLFQASSKRWARTI